MKNALNTVIHANTSLVSIALGLYGVVFLGQVISQYAA
ncbi:MAG: hypothetical protein ACJAXQ_001435 [Parvibaculaceae bacterium]|jgi:hypothetical protein